MAVTVAVVGAAFALLAGLLLMHIFVDGFSVLGIGASFGGGIYDILSGVGLGLSVLLGLAIVGVLAYIVILGSRDPDSDPGALGEAALLIRTGAAVVFVGAIALWLGADGAFRILSTYWWFLPLIAFGWFVYVYLSHRQQVASASTALDRVTRTTRREISEKSKLVTGTAVVGVTFVAAVVSGLLEGLSGLGDVLLMFAGEGAYLFTVLLGYVQLGGDVPAWVDVLTPQLTGMQWAALTLLLGAVTIMVSESR